MRTTMIYYSRYLTFYLLLNLTVDRFLGIFRPHWYRKLIKCSNIRLSMLWLWITASSVPHMTFGTIERVGDVWEARSISRLPETPLLNMYKTYILVCMLLIPAIALVTFTILITVRIITSTKQSKHRTTYIRNTIAVMIVNVSYIVLMSICGSILYSVQVDYNHCYTDYKRELALLLCEVLLILWSIINVVTFLIICSEYRTETKYILIRMGFRKPITFEPMKLNELRHKWTVNKIYSQ